MNILVKVCGLRDAGHVAAAVAAGANAIGFVFAESVRRITPQAARAAALEIPPSVHRVAVMRHPTNDEWDEVLDVFSPDVLQTDADDIVALDVPDSVTLWPVIREGREVAEKFFGAEFVYEGGNSGHGEAVDWSLAARVAKRGRMILAGGLSPSNIATAIRIVRPFGVDVSSGIESRPGEKNPDLIRQFIGAVRTAESSL
jgi:phosphoribosylanthranilate isomerase